jgi:hypothetical protein
LTNEIRGIRTDKIADAIAQQCPTNTTAELLSTETKSFSSLRWIEWGGHQTNPSIGDLNGNASCSAHGIVEDALRATNEQIVFQGVSSRWPTVVTFRSCISASKTTSSLRSNAPNSSRVSLSHDVECLMDIYQ